MDAGAMALLIPVAAIVMGGLATISKHFTRSGGPANTNAMEARLEELEQDLAGVRRELAETQERVDFAERLLSQAREGKRIP